MEQSIDIKRDMCNEILSLLEKQCDVPVDTFETIFYYVAQKYDIQIGCTDLVPVDESDYNYIKKFLVCKKIEGLSEKTLYRYERELTTFYNWVNGRKSITDTKADDVRAYLAEGMITNDWKPTHCNNKRVILSSFFQWMTDEEYSKTNPCRKVKKIKTPKHVREPFTDQEIEKMRNKLEVGDEKGMVRYKILRDRAVFEFLLSSGCRVTEISQLKIKDVNFRAKEAKVFGKGSKERMVFFNEIAAYHLNQYMSERGDTSPDDYLFAKALGDHDCQLKVSGIEIFIRELGRSADVKAFPHKFRHTAATRALKRGMPIDQVRIMLGHESMDTTLIYAQSDLSEVKFNHSKYL